MARPRSGPTAPRESPPDLPAHLDLLDPHSGVMARVDLSAVRVEGLAGAVSAAHGRLVEARIDDASVDRFDLTGTTLTDVAVRDLRATELLAREGSWRSVEIIGGRIATLDASRASWDGIRLQGIRVDYLSLASADVGDLLVIDCQIGTLDLPQARVNRVAFQDSRIDEIDTRGLRSDHLDLRGAEVLRFTDPKGLAGATLSVRQAELHGPALADALGIRLAP